MAKRPLSVAIVCEDKAHLHLATVLADAVAREHLGLSPDQPLEAWRRWRGEEGQPTLKLKDVSKTLRAQRVPSGRPLFRSRRTQDVPEAEAAPMIDAYEVFATQEDPPDAVIVLIDADKMGKERREGAELAHQHVYALPKRRVPVFVVGVCDPMAEGWLITLLAEVEPVRARRLLARGALGFDPAARSERLSTDDKQPHHAKRVAHFLLDAEHATLQRAPATTPNEGMYRDHLQAVVVSVSTLDAQEGCGLAQLAKRLREDYAPQLGR